MLKYAFFCCGANTRFIQQTVGYVVQMLTIQASKSPALKKRLTEENVVKQGSMPAF